MRSKRINNEDWQIQRTWTRGSRRTLAVNCGSTVCLDSKIWWAGRVQKKSGLDTFAQRSSPGGRADSVEISLLSDCGPVAVGPVVVVAGG
jgi:hypothetical protein